MKSIIFILCLALTVLTVSVRGEVIRQPGDSLISPEASVQGNGVQYFPRFRLALGGGLSYRLSPVSEDATPDRAKYLRNLKSGFNIGGELVFFPTKLIGVGLKYSLSQASSSGEFYEPALHSTMKLSETVAIQYFGPQLALRFLNKSQKNAFLMRYSFGFVRYSSEIRQGFFPRKVVGNSFGFALAYSYEFGLSDNFALGAQVSAVLASISSYTQTLSSGHSTAIDLPEDQREGLSHIAFTVFLRFRKI